ncbi:acyltransferase [Chryseobacterium populi]|uniref:Acetyltransferase (Isoleucine patch superfamily) n=1 Tax=Chryseobacterium populi TaxID=1144316 RepID=J2KPA3_9FLAO|nr:acyltransferase [Chryseobacterium populi]EJL74908.1 acetyltransferase (isoleucine patch superfamily) [Chryseobacterium populi]
MKKILRNLRRKILTYIAFYRSGKNKEVFKSIILGWVKLNKNTKVGQNVSFNGCTIYGNGKVEIGDNFHSAKGLIMLTTYHNHNGNKIPYDETVIHKDIKIGDNVWIGMNVIVLGGATIGEGAIVQAGSVVSKSIPPLAIAGGNPATPFKNRDEKRYFELKAEKKFQ